MAWYSLNVEVNGPKVWSPDPKNFFYAAFLTQSEICAVCSSRPGHGCGKFVARENALVPVTALVAEKSSEPTSISQKKQNSLADHENQIKGGPLFVERGRGVS
jgi:hypothetical protein